MWPNKNKIKIKSQDKGKQKSQCKNEYWAMYNKLNWISIL